jgi:hypothetical protein
VLFGFPGSGPPLTSFSEKTSRSCGCWVRTRTACLEDLSKRSISAIFMPPAAFLELPLGRAENYPAAQGTWFDKCPGRAARAIRKPMAIIGSTVFDANRLRRREVQPQDGQVPRIAGPLSFLRPATRTSISANASASSAACACCMCFVSTCRSRTPVLADRVTFCRERRTADSDSVNQGSNPCPPAT